MLVNTKDIIAVYKQLFNDGVLVCHKDFTSLHPIFGIPNLQVFMLMKGLKTKKMVKETCNWRVLYWTLNDEGVAYLRKILCLPEEAKPSTHKTQTNSTALEEARKIQRGGFRKNFGGNRKPEMKKAE